MTSHIPSLPPPTPLGYDRLRPPPLPSPNPTQTRSRTHLLLLSLAAALLAAACAATVFTILKSRNPSGRAGPTHAIALACGPTEYPALCMDALAASPGTAAAVAPHELVSVSMNVTLGRFDEALTKSTAVGDSDMGTYDKSAYRVCLELLDDSVDMLNRSLAAVAAARFATGDESTGLSADVITWLSAALTNQDTCREVLSSANEELRLKMYPQLQNLTELVTNTLTMYATTRTAGAAHNAATLRHNRRLVSSYSHDMAPHGGFPSWVSRADRALLESAPVTDIRADVVVSKYGFGTVETIGEALAMAPVNSQRRFVIYVTSGKYEEDNLRVDSRLTNIWLVGDGMGETVITGSKSVDQNNVTTFDTATFGVSGDKFVARDITFENKAGPNFHQAVALRVSGDKCLIFRCEIKGHQDTLYTYTKRQFFRECTISGTVDFILGNSAVVFQNSTIYSRKEVPGQQCVITAQSRSQALEGTGMSFHACEFRLSSGSSCQTYLGRPWRDYARVVYMMSYLGGHIEPRGWLEWMEGSRVDKVYYGEYRNYGPGARLAGRVKWPGVHDRLTKREASRFTVGRFISGATWLTQTGVGYRVGLNT